MLRHLLFLVFFVFAVLCPVVAQQVDSTSTQEPVQYSEGELPSAESMSSTSSVDDAISVTSEISTFALAPDLLGALTNSVNLYTGKVVFPLNLVSLPGRNGLNVSVSLSYNSAGVKRQAETWNREAPTSIVGLGWSMPYEQIVVDHKGTGTRHDDTYYLLTGGASVKLIKKSEVTSGVHEYEALEPYQFWKIRYYETGQKWEVTKEDGSTSVYGNTSDPSLKSVQWGVRWGNWIGNSSLTAGQVRMAVAWNLSEIRSFWGDVVTFKYDEVTEAVGSGGQLYTQASYLSEIVDSYGRRVVFSYADKLYDGSKKEYQESRTQASEPDAYQERYEKKYLSYVEVFSESNDKMLSVHLSYTVIGGEELAKRLLTGVVQRNADEEELPGLSFAYHEGATDYTQGSLMNITTPAGGVIAYTYAQQTITSATLDRAITAPAGYSQPRVWVMPDYTVVTWRNPTTKEVRVYVYTWEGEWVETFLQSIPGVEQESGTYGVNPQDFDIFPSGDFFALIKHTKVESPTINNTIYIWRRDRATRGGWISYNSSVQTDESIVSAHAGDDFLAVISSAYGYTYIFDKSSGGTWIKTQVTGKITNVPTLTEGAKLNFIGGDSNYYLIHRSGTGLDWDTESVEIRYKDELGLWNFTQVPSALVTNSIGNTNWWGDRSHILGGIPRGDDDLYLVYSWDTGYSDIDTTHIGHVEPSNLGYVFSAGNALVGARDNMSNSKIAAYAGSAWIPQPGLPYAAGHDYAIQRSAQSSNASGSLYQFNADSGAWSNTPLSASAMGLYAHPHAGGDFFLFGYDFYYRNPNNSWTKQSTLPAPSGSYSNIDDLSVRVGVNYLTYSTANLGLPSLYIRYVRNGLISSSQGLISGRKAHFRASSTTGETSNLVGAASFVSYPSTVTNFDALSSSHSEPLRLHRVGFEAVFGSQQDIVVSSIEVQDGLNTTSSAFAYAQASATYDPSGYTAQYNEVTTVAGSPNAADAPNGYTKSYFHNGLSSSDARLSLAYPGNTSNQTRLLAGSPYAVRHFDASGSLVAAITTVYQTFPKDVGPAGNQQRAYYTRAVRADNQQDGISSYTTTDYSADTGLPMQSTQYELFNSQGIAETVTTFYTYGWEKYTALLNGHLLTPVVQAKTVNSSTHGSTLVSLAATRWKQWPAFGNKWSPQQEYIFAGSGSSTTNFENWTGTTEPLPSSGWIKASDIISRDSKGNVTESVDALGVHAATFYGFGQSRPLLVAANATHAELLADNFDDGSLGGSDPFQWYTSGSWSVQGQALTHTSLSAQGTASPYRTVAQTNFSADFDIRVDAGQTSLDWFGFQFRKTSVSHTHSSSGYLLYLRQNGSLDLYHKDAGGVVATYAVPGGGSGWHQVHLDVQDKRIVVHVDGTLAIDFTDTVTRTGTYVGFGAYRAQGQVDNLRLYPLEASAVSYAHDAKTRRTVHVTGPRGERSRMSYGSFGEVLGSVGPMGVPKATTATYAWTRHSTTYDAAIPHQSLATVARGTDGTYESFEGGGLLNWTAKPFVNVTSWQMQHNRLKMSSSVAGGSWSGDYFYVDLGKEYKGRVAVEMSVRTTTAHTNWSLGLAMGSSTWPVASSNTGRALWSAFSSSSQWQHYDYTGGGGAAKWTSIYTGFKTNQTYRLKVVVDVDAQKADYYVDGRLMQAGLALPSSVAGIRKVALFNYGQVSAPLEWFVDEMMVYTDPVHTMTFADNAGRTRQVQQEVDGGTLVAETLYDKVGRAAVQTLPVQVSSRFGYRASFVVDTTDGSFAWNLGTSTLNSPQMTGEVANGRLESGGYPYSRTIFESSPLARVKETRAPGGDYLSSYRATRGTYRAFVAPSNFAITLPANQYAEVVTEDADGNRSALIVDKRGRTVAKASIEEQSGSEPELAMVPGDAVGPVQSVTEPGEPIIVYSNISWYEYDARGNVTKIRPPNYYAPPSGSTGAQFQESAIYDARGLLASRYTPDGGTEQMKYDRLGRLRFAIAGNSLVSGSTHNVKYWKYDALGRVTEEGYFASSWGSTLDGQVDNMSYPTSPATWRRKYEYGTISEPLAARHALRKVLVNSDSDTAAEVQHVYHYDVEGRAVKSEERVEDYAAQWYATEYAHDNTGAVTSMTYPTGDVVIYGYDRAGRLAEVGKPGETQHYARYEYDNRGEMGSACLNTSALAEANQVSRCVTYTRDGSGRLVQIQGAGFTGTLTYTSGGYGGAGYYNGRIASTAFSYPVGTVSGYTYQYAYDKPGQLTVADHSANSAWDLGVGDPLQYDANGNLRRLKQGIVTKLYVYTAGTNRVRNYDGLTSADHFGYDGAGNVTRSDKRGITQIMYDPYSNLPVLLVKNGTTSYQYDGGGERTLKKRVSGGATYETLYLRGEAAYPLVVRSRTNGSETSVMVHVYGAGGLIAQHAPAQAHSAQYVVTDHLGSTRVMFSGSTGQTVSAYAYAPFGQETQVWQDQARYTYTGQEWDDESGVYNYRARLYDPELGRFYTTDPAEQYFSPYRYAGNNPVLMSDPSGTFAFAPVLIAVGYGALIGGTTSAAIYTVGATMTGDFSLRDLGNATLGGAIGGGISGGFGGVATSLGAVGNSIAVNMLTNTSANVATTLIMGGSLDAGTFIGGIAGGLAGAAIPQFTGVKGGWVQNLSAEVGYSSARGGLIGAVSGGVAAAVNGRSISDGARTGMIHGAIHGAGGALAWNAIFGAAIVPPDDIKKALGALDETMKEEWGITTSSHPPVYRRGGISKLFPNGNRGLAMGRNLVIPASGSRSGDAYTFIHETVHYYQTIRYGFGLHAAKAAYATLWMEFARGLNPYRIQGNNEYEADMITYKILDKFF